MSYVRYCVCYCIPHGSHTYTAISYIYIVYTYKSCIHIQVGKQLEWLTGSRFVAGYHEVVCSADTIRAYEQACAIQHNTTTNNTNNDTNSSSGGRDDIWRVSCTLFSQVNTDYILQPLLQESHNYDPSNEGSINRYPSVLAGEMIKNELKVISLHSSENEEAVTS